MNYLTFSFSLLLLFACSKKTEPIEVITTSQNSNSESLIQAISIIDENNVWVSGHKGTYAHTTDGGKNWMSSVVPNADTLQFRDIHAFSNNEVILMSAGTGTLSQIRKTINGGKSWKITYMMTYSTGFLNSIEFWDDQNGLAFGDAVEGELFVLKTTDGGDTWERVDPVKLPAALGSEGGFAASGTCIAVKGKGKAWIGTGAGERPRVIYTTDYGESWEESATPIVSGEAAGIASINFWDEENGFISGGDLSVPDEYYYNVGFTTNGGKTWSLAEHPVLKGSVYGNGVATFKDQEIVFVSGPKGIDYSNDFGTTWTSIDTANYWAVKFSENGVGWATGTDGKILKISLQ